MEKDSSPDIWSSLTDPLDLLPHQVDVWRIMLDMTPATVKWLGSHLSADESQRAARFRFHEDRKRFIISHGCLRDILSRYLNCPPGQLIFSTNDYGRPYLKSYELEFNLSHSGDFALLAITRDRKVGVDLERFRPEMEFESIARRFFSPNEVSELLALPLEQREAAFFNCWTRKEAYIKAHGLGLSLPLDSFDVSLGEPALLRATRPDSQETSTWNLLSLEVDPGYAGALAVEGQDMEFRLWDWNLPTR